MNYETHPVFAQIHQEIHLGNLHAIVEAHQLETHLDSLSEKPFKAFIPNEVPKNGPENIQAAKQMIPLILAILILKGNLIKNDSSWQFRSEEQLVQDTINLIQNQFQDNDIEKLEEEETELPSQLFHFKENKPNYSAHLLLYFTLCAVEQLFSPGRHEETKAPLNITNAKEIALHNLRVHEDFTPLLQLELDELSDAGINLPQDKIPDFYLAIRKVFNGFNGSKISFNTDGSYTLDDNTVINSEYLKSAFSNQFITDSTNAICKNSTDHTYKNQVYTALETFLIRSIYREIASVNNDDIADLLSKHLFSSLKQVKKEEEKKEENNPSSTTTTRNLSNKYEVAQAPRIGETTSKDDFSISKKEKKKTHKRASSLDSTSSFKQEV